jgi:hypothetical protein
MSAFLVQNGEYVNRVEVGSNVQYFANSIRWPHTEFLVTDNNGDEILRKYVSVDWLGNVWLDEIAPTKTGSYRFYPDSADMATYLQFTVVPVGSGGGLDDGGDDSGGLVGWWDKLTTWQKVGVAGGGALAGIILIAGIDSVVRRK